MPCTEREEGREGNEMSGREGEDMFYGEEDLEGHFESFIELRCGERSRRGEEPPGKAARRKRKKWLRLSE